MGLTFDWQGRQVAYRDQAGWSYSGFHCFRRRLAREIGVCLDEMSGFEGEISWDGIDDPIVPFLYHSDSEGELAPDECRQIAPRLRELVQDWPDDYDRQNALALADHMDECARLDVPLEFC